MTRPFVSSPSFVDLFSTLESLLEHLGPLWSSRWSIAIGGLAWSTASATLGDLLHSPVLGRVGAEVWGLLASVHQRAAKASLCCSVIDICRIYDPGEFGDLVWGLLTDLRSTSTNTKTVREGHARVSEASDEKRQEADFLQHSPFVTRYYQPLRRC